MEKEYTNYRLDEQIEWYDKKSQKNQRNYKLVRILEVILGALITISAGFEWPYALIGLFGFMIIIFEAIQNIYQYHYLWISYRSTCERLKKEKHFFIVKAGPYTDCENPNRELAERIEELISQEHAHWIKEINKLKSKTENKSK